MFERMKRKENKEWKEKYGETQRGRKHSRIVFVILFVYLKQSEKEKKLMATNY